MRLRAIAMLVLIALAGCERPATHPMPPAPIAASAPKAYKEEPPQSFAESKDWKHSLPADTLAKGKWWEAFHDPALNEIEERVDVGNQSLKSAEARFRQARAYIQEARAARLPTVSAGASITRNRLSLNRAVPVPAYETGNGDFSLHFDAEYELDLWGRVRSLIAASAESAQATAADIQTVRLSLHAEVALAYFGLRNLESEQRILDRTVASYERALALRRRRFAGGIITQADVAQAETNLEAARAQQLDLAERRARFTHALATLTGQTADVFSVTETKVQFAAPSIAVGLPSELLERRPDIAAAERRVAIANTQVGLTKVAFFPRVMLGLTAGLEGGSIANWFNWPSRLWALGPSAAQMLFDAGRRRAATDGAIANYDATIADYRRTVLTAFQQVEDQAASLRVLEAEAAKQKDAIAAARRAEALALNRYNGGLVTYLEVSAAQTTTLQNERILSAIEHRQMEASVLLIKALGGSWDVKSLPTTESLTGR